MRLDEVVWIEGPVMKICGELAVLIAVGEDGPYSECLKVVISDQLARTSQIEPGDLVCLRSADGRFTIQPVKARNAS